MVKTDRQFVFGEQHMSIKHNTCLLKTKVQLHVSAYMITCVPNGTGCVTPCSYLFVGRELFIFKDTGGRDGLD